MDLSDSQSVRALPWLIYSVNMAGLIGNLFSFMIFSRPVFSKSPYRIYFKSLAIFDSFVVFNLVIGIASLINKIDLFNQINQICKFVYFVSVATSPNSGWMLVVFSIDQLVRVRMSKRFSFVKKRHFQYISIGSLVLFHFLIAVSVITQVEVQDVTVNNITRKMCQYPPKSSLPIIYLIESCLIPFGIMLVTTGLILKSLYESRLSLKKYLITRNSLSTAATTPCIKPTVTATVKTSKRGRDLKFAFNSVIFNTLFIILTIPLVFVHLSRRRDVHLSSADSNDVRSGFIVFKAVCFFLFNLNFALHFWIHFSVNRIFRYEVLVMFRIRRTPQHVPVHI